MRHEGEAEVAVRPLVDARAPLRDRHALNHTLVAAAAAVAVVNEESKKKQITM